MKRQLILWGAIAIVGVFVSCKHKSSSSSSSSPTDPVNSTCSVGLNAADLKSLEAVHPSGPINPNNLVASGLKVDMIQYGDAQYAHVVFTSSIVPGAAPQDYADYGKVTICNSDRSTCMAPWVTGLWDDNIVLSPSIAPGNIQILATACANQNNDQGQFVKEVCGSETLLPKLYNGKVGSDFYALLKNMQDNVSQRTALAQELIKMSKNYLSYINGVDRTLTDGEKLLRTMAINITQNPQMVTSFFGSSDVDNLIGQMTAINKDASQSNFHLTDCVANTTTSTSDTSIAPPITTTTSDATLATITPASNALGIVWFQIKSKNSSECLTIQGPSNGSIIYQLPCSSNLSSTPDSQLFQVSAVTSPYYVLSSKTSGLCLGVDLATNNINQVACNSTPPANQLFVVNPVDATSKLFTIQSQPTTTTSSTTSANCMINSAKTDQANIVMGACGNETSQFYLTQMPYTTNTTSAVQVRTPLTLNSIIADTSKFCMYGAGNYSGAPIGQIQCDTLVTSNVITSQWQLIGLGGQFYTFMNQGNNLCWADDPTNQDALMLQTCDPTNPATQQFVFTAQPAGSQHFLIKTATDANLAKCLAVSPVSSGGTTSNAAFTTTCDQTFSLTQPYDVSSSASTTKVDQYTGFVKGLASGAPTDQMIRSISQIAMVTFGLGLFITISARLAGNSKKIVTAGSSFKKAALLTPEIVNSLQGTGIMNKIRNGFTPNYKIIEENYHVELSLDGSQVLVIKRADWDKVINNPSVGTDVESRLNQLRSNRAKITELTAFDTISRDSFKAHVLEGSRGNNISLIINSVGLLAAGIVYSQFNLDDSGSNGSANYAKGLNDLVQQWNTARTQGAMLEITKELSTPSK